MYTSPTIRLSTSVAVHCHEMSLSWFHHPRRLLQGNSGTVGSKESTRRSFDSRYHRKRGSSRARSLYDDHIWAPCIGPCHSPLKNTEQFPVISNHESD